MFRGRVLPPRLKTADDRRPDRRGGAPRGPWRGSPSGAFDAFLVATRRPGPRARCARTLPHPTRRRGDGDLSTVLVLNACWHHGIDHVMVQAVEDDRGDRVLNACWHHGIDHPRRRSYSWKASTGAQRLLASRNRSRAMSPRTAARVYVECSTPAGITESITLDAAAPHLRDAVVVLNACWHHGIDHSRPRTRPESPGPGAQRLLASRNRSLEAANTS